MLKDNLQWNRGSIRVREIETIERMNQFYLISFGSLMNIEAFILFKILITKFPGKDCMLYAYKQSIMSSGHKYTW